MNKKVLSLICIVGLLCAMTACRGAESLSPGETGDNQSTAEPTGTGTSPDQSTTEPPQTTQQPEQTDDQPDSLGLEIELDDFPLAERIPIYEVFPELELPATVADILAMYDATHRVSRWSDIGAGYFTEMVYEDKEIDIWTLNIKEGIEINFDKIVLDENMLIFDEDSTVFIYERMFDEIIWDTVHKAERVEELIENVLDNERVDDVKVFENISDKEKGIQIFEGDVQNGMYVYITVDGAPHE